MDARQRMRLQTAFWLACTWPAVSYVALMVWRLGIGGIAFKLAPLLIAYHFEHELRSQAPPNEFSKLVAQAIKVQLVLVVALEALAFLLVMVTGVTFGTVASGLLMVLIWALHVVVGALVFKKAYLTPETAPTPLP